jgi:hypothetical protein
VGEDSHIELKRSIIRAARWSRPLIVVVIKTPRDFHG